MIKNKLVKKTKKAAVMAIIATMMITTVTGCSSPTTLEGFDATEYSEERTDLVDVMGDYSSNIWRG